jgi:hypothetical protein
MLDYKCHECERKLELGDIVVSSEKGKIFCQSDHSPLEEGSCARNYIEGHPEENNQTYFFIKLGE